MAILYNQAWWVHINSSEHEEDIVLLQYHLPTKRKSLAFLKFHPGTEVL